jgi:hypothetical protein
MTPRRQGAQEPTQGLDGIQVAMRMAGASLTQEELLKRIKKAKDNIPTTAVSLIRLLEDGVEQANEPSELNTHSLWWNVSEKRFDPASESVRRAPADPASSI